MNDEMLRFHEIGIRCFFDEIRLLFQRASFLLAGNAFLVVGFVMVATNSEGDSFEWLTIGIVALGLAVSCVQLGAGYCGSRTAKHWMEYVSELEKETDWYKIHCKNAKTEATENPTTPPLIKVYAGLLSDEIRKCPQLDYKPTLGQEWIDAIFRRLLIAPFAWLILPLLLVFFWLAMLISYLVW